MGESNTYKNNSLILINKINGDYDGKRSENFAIEECDREDI